MKRSRNEADKASVRCGSLEKDPAVHGLNVCRVLYACLHVNWTRIVVISRNLILGWVSRYSRIEYCKLGTL